MNTDYRYPLHLFWSNEDEGFIAEVPDLPGCSAWGHTEADAAREAQDAIAAWLEAAQSAKRTIPVPSVAEPMGSYRPEAVGLRAGIAEPQLGDFTCAELGLGDPMGRFGPEHNLHPGWSAR